MPSKVKIPALITLLIICCLHVLTLSRPDKSDRLDAYLTSLYENQEFNGVVLAAEKGRVIFKKAYGFADIEAQTMLTTATPFNLASVSKQFTAMGIMILVEKGKLKYNDPMVTYLPELDYKNNKSITIGHLLNHTSGLVEYVMLLRKYNRSTDQVVCNSDIVHLFETYQPKQLFEAGSVFKYSNTGYMLLAVIIERVSGDSYPVFLKRNIFDPLEMRNSFAYNLKMAECPQARAVGFASDKIRFERYDLIYLDGIMGDGNVYSSADDLFKWDQALYTEKLVNKSTITRALTPGRLNDGSTFDYGFGWIISPDRKSVTHSGAWRGFRTMIYRDIKKKNTLIFLDNSTNSMRSRQIRHIHNLLKGKKYPLPKKSIASALLTIIRDRGIDEAVRRYYELKRTQQQAYNFNENSLNLLGYRLLNQGKINEAIRIFQLNVEAFPRSFNAYDSLGEAYMAKNEKELAVKYYEKSLELNPANANAREKLEELNK